MLKYLSITAGIFLIIFPCLLAGQVQPAYELAHHSACPYNGRNYDVYYVWLDSLNMLRYENFYEEGTKVPSLYDSD